MVLLRSVRKHYLFQKFAATVACFLLLYNTIEHYVMPVLEETLNITFVHSVVSLLFPFMVILRCARMPACLGSAVLFRGFVHFAIRCATF